MRQGPHQKRSRGRGNGGRKPHSSPRNHTYDSNGPEVRIRGTAYQVHEKYMGLARDASASGDRIRAENLLQHAEHYLRIIQAEEAAQAEYEEQQQRHNGNRNQGGERNFEPRGERTREERYEDRQSGDGQDEDGDGQIVMLNRRPDGAEESEDRPSGRQAERSDRQAERRQRPPRDESRNQSRDEDDSDGLQRMMGLGGASQGNASQGNATQANGSHAGQPDGEGDEGAAPRRGPLRRPRRPRTAETEPADASAAPEAGEAGEQPAPTRRRRTPRSRGADGQGTLPVEEESGAA